MTEAEKKQLEEDDKAMGYIPRLEERREGEKASRG